MDLWGWVTETERRLRKEGHTRLADLIDRLPSEVCNDQHQRVDAIFPEALALAQSLELHWVEVFLRHWSLQSRVLHRMDGNALRDAVSLIEFAHREETRGCPQGVCAVQDLAACYAFVDGSGYADERLAVADETLARIDPSWPCFTCISSEYASALRAKGDVEGSLAFVDKQVARLVEKGQRDAIYDLPRDRMEALIDLGKYDEALSFLDQLEKRGRRDAHHRLSRRLDRARILGRLGRAKEALQHLPNIDEIRPTPLFYWFWADAAAELVRAGVAPNDSQLGLILQSFVDRLFKQGVGRTTLELAELHGRLALERGAPHVARRALGTMERCLDVLARPLDALDRVARLRAAIAAAPEHGDVVVPDTAAEVLAKLRAGEGRDPERDLLLLEAARARFPDDVPVLLALAGCYLATGVESEAIDQLRAFHEKTGNDDVFLRLGELLVGRDVAALQRLVDRHRALARDPASAAMGDWLLARDAHTRGDYRACRDHLDRVLVARPEAINSRLLWADAARRLGDLEGALGRLDEVIARVAEPGPPDWDRMVVATLLGDYARVRESARRVGFEVAGDGPIDERWGVCRVRFDDDGAASDVWCVRTGPVTARVLEIARPDREQQFDDVVVFDATPLNAPPEKDEDAERHVYVYPYIATVARGGHRAYEIDGVHPGDDGVEQLRRAVHDLGCELQILSGDEYSLTRGEEELPGMFAVVAAPETVSARTLSDALREATRSFVHPLIWLALATEAKDSELAEAHVRAADDYGL